MKLAKKALGEKKTISADELKPLFKDIIKEMQTRLGEMDMEKDGEMFFDMSTWTDGIPYLMSKKLGGKASDYRLFINRKGEFLYFNIERK